MMRRNLLFVGCLVLQLSLVSADDPITQEIITFSKSLRESFKPAKTTFERRNVVNSEESTDVFLQDEGGFLYETNTAICAANPKYSFFLKRNAIDEAWELKSLQPLFQTDSEAQYVLQVKMIDDACYGWLTANAFRIDEYLQIPGAEATVVRTGQGESEEVNLEIKIADPKQRMPSGEAIVMGKVTANYLPNRFGWIPIETQAFWAVEGRCIRENREFIRQGEFMVPRETEFKIFQTKSSTNPYLHNVTRLVYSDDKFDADRLMVSHYGFKEPVLPGGERSRIGALIVIGLFLFLIAWSFTKLRIGRSESL